MNFSIDEKSMIILRKIYPVLRGHAIFVMTEMWQKQKMQLRITQGYRSFEAQLKLYNQGRVTPGPKVTNAKPGLSYHNYGLAVDFCFKGKDPYLENHPKKVELWMFLGKLIEDSGCYWGGLFKNPDMPHMEFRVKGFTPQDCLTICEKYGIRGLWIEIDRALGREPGEGYDLLPEWGE
jgi:peptidoglycan L-alanyl-D-glutamate endopeptidase CwlK